MPIDFDIFPETLRMRGFHDKSPSRITPKNAVSVRILFLRETYERDCTSETQSHASLFVTNYGAYGEILFSLMASV